MKLKGKFKLKNKEKIFECQNESANCTNCLRKIRKGEMVYICTLDQTVYCSCFVEKNSPPCKNTLFRREHKDTNCKLVFL